MRHWSDPASASLAQLREGAVRTLEVGHVSNWGYCVNQSFKFGFLTGEPLDDLESRYQRDWAALTHRQQIPARGSVEIWGQAVANLRGQSENPARLTGDRLPLDAAFPIFVQLKVGPLIQYIVFLEVMLAYLFDEPERAVERGGFMEEVVSGQIQGLAFPQPLRLWYRSLAALDLPDPTEHLDAVRADRELLAGWAERSPANHAHRVALLDAELARVEDRPLDAMSAYDEAIRLAGVHPYPQDVALANERAARFHLAARRDGVGSAYLDSAVAGYRAWGARAKVEQLEARHADALRPREAAAPDLDVDAVLKATAAISSEIVLEELLLKLLSIVLENAGASRAAVALVRGDELLLRAVHGEDGATVLDGMPPEEHREVPASVLRYVARTRQTILLDDVAADSRFAGVSTRSVLCLPLVRSGELVGVLYLENDLAASAFTPQRVALLEALSSQIAIAAENAALYENLRVQADAFARFVPRQFLSFLRRASIEEVCLGDAVAREMAVLFGDLRDFTTLSEGMTPTESFEFLNRYLGRIGPVIRANRGFVDKYIGDAVMALFPRSPDDALRAAIAMQAQTATLPPVAGQPVAMGVGLHTGKLILGVLGESERMDGTVISDAVNIGARLEGLTKKYGVGIIASQAMISGCSEPERFPHRCLGDEVVKGKAEPVRIYEVFAGDEPAVLEGKLRTRGDFEEAVAAMAAGNAADAFVLLRSVQSVLPDDGVTKMLMSRAAQAVTGAYAKTV